MPPRLKALMTWLQAETGQSIPHRWYTDTGPVLERDLAQRAGLGWIGKNTCLIHPRQGSYFLLAEILLKLDLEPDAPFLADRCGDCQRCVQACPTQCILPDRTLDARRCISYLTIENKEAIPPALRSQVGDWVFGCDLCQQVCPWNQRFASGPADSALAARPDHAKPGLIELLALSPQDFNRHFKGSPIKRAKRRGLLRNAAVALGNRLRGQSEPAVAAALIRALSDAEPLVRQHVAWALGQVGGSPVRQALEQALQNEPDPAVQAEIRAALQ
jgi:epoxyqueuosine reductase